MQTFIIIYFILKFGSIFSLPIKNDLVIAELTDEQISIASRALRNDILIAGPISKHISNNAIASDFRRWPDGVLYYSIDYELMEHKQLIHNTLSVMMEEIGVRSDGRHCISLIPRTNQQNYVTFINGSDGCKSYIGRSFQDMQPIWLSDKGCTHAGTIMHETMHALGFYHEHQRTDRNGYVDILWENVIPEAINQFDINLDDRLFAPFDYDSIMIYGNKAFSFNNGDTIVARNGQRLIEAHRKNSLTEYNIKAIRALYDCEAQDIIPTITHQTTHQPELVSTNEPINSTHDPLLVSTHEPILSTRDPLLVSTHEPILSTHEPIHATHEPLIKPTESEPNSCSQLSSMFGQTLTVIFLYFMFSFFMI